MSSPIVNLKKTNMGPEKIINGYNGIQTESQGIKNHRRSLEEEVNDIRRNSVSSIEIEKLLLQMNLRMTNLEDQVKGVKDELTKAVEVINRKDEEIEMLKEQLLQSGRQQTHPHFSNAKQMRLENEYLKEQYDRLNATIGNMSPKEARRFYHKGDVTSTEGGNTNDKKKYCAELEKRKPKERSLYEEIFEDVTLMNNAKKTKPKRLYVDDIENEGIDELLAKRVDDYVQNLSATSISVSSCEEINNMDLENENLRLAHQISEMEKFLADYGMIWVGEQKINDGKHGDRIIKTGVGFSPNFDKVIMVIEELNERASSESHIKVTGNEAKFEKAAILNLTLYSDGMQLEDNHFREYTSESVKAFFQDLEDGYYPTELKESHPKGVIFKITDKRSVMFEDFKNDDTSFNGPGFVLGICQSSDEEPDKKERMALDKGDDNITYHEAPSSGPDIIREVSIGPIGSQSEPVISTGQPKRYRSYGSQRQQAHLNYTDRERNSHQINYDNEANYNTSGQPPHHQSYGTQHQQVHQNYTERKRNSRQMNYGDEANNGTNSDPEETKDHRKSFLSTEYENAYGQNSYNIGTMLDKKKSKSQGPIEGFNEKYEHITIIGSNLDTQQMSQEENKETDKSQVSAVNVEADDEPVMTALNKKTSDEQLELTMKSYDGKQIYSAYLYPDDPINKIWRLTKLSSDVYEVAAADKVLDLTVPLKNYNINGDVTLNIVKRKPGTGNKTVTDKKPLSSNTAIEDEGIDSPDEEDIAPPEISKMDVDEEGYSS